MPTASTVAKLYTLADPRTGMVRYVGWTSGALARRLCEHVSDARCGGKNHRCNWIRFLLAEGRKPTVQLVAICGVDEGPAAEVDLIAALRACGYRLTNSTDGGEGVLGRKHTPEARAKLSEAARGNKRCFGRKLSTETREKIAVKHRGVPSSQGAREALSRAIKGKPHSREWVEHQAAALRGKTRSPEAIEKSAAGRRGKKYGPRGDEWCANIASGLRAYWEKKRGGPCSSA